MWEANNLLFCKHAIPKSSGTYDESKLVLLESVGDGLVAPLASFKMGPVITSYLGHPKMLGYKL